MAVKRMRCSSGCPLEQAAVRDGLFTREVRVVEDWERRTAAGI
jgi:hypothetical protein